MRRFTALLSTTGLVVGSLVFVAPASPASGASATTCDSRTNNTINKLLACVTLDGVRAHQAALQAIADANGGTRATGTPGYDASADYAVGVLEAAGYNVTLDPVEYTYIAPSELVQVSPIAATYETGAFTGSGSGVVTGTVIPVDINLVPPRDSTSGCEAADFAGLDFSGPADIALIQRGVCSFSVKALNAEAAGAEAVVLFNQGDTPDREGLIVGTLGDEVAGIPVVGASFDAGVALSQPGSTAYVNVPPNETRTTYNVLAESRIGNANNVVMVGAHLDSVDTGPGINDNGSGVAAILETAEQMSKVNPRNKVRFALWGAEELGLVGSEAYVENLSQEEQDAITLYLNFDMIGSPNHVFFVYDGDDSDGVGAPPGPAGSAQIERTFEAYYDRVGLPYKGTDFSGLSDYGPFLAVGIPSGGLFTGASRIKTAEEAAIWGGTAGVAYDPCYHRACDTYDSINLAALDTNSDAVAFATLKYAMSTSGINGVRGKGNFEPRAFYGGPVPTS